MQFEHSFTMPVGVAEAWLLLRDRGRVAAALPDADLRAAADGAGLVGTVPLTIGPISVPYQVRLTAVRRDDANRTLVLEADGREVAGLGATAVSTIVILTADGPGAAHGDVVTDLTMTGRLAQFGPGRLAEAGRAFVDEFARRLVGELDGAAVYPDEVRPLPVRSAPAEDPAGPAVDRPRSGLAGDTPALAEEPAPALAAGPPVRPRSALAGPQPRSALAAARAPDAVLPADGPIGGGRRLRRAPTPAAGEPAPTTEGTPARVLLRPRRAPAEVPTPAPGADLVPVDEAAKRRGSAQVASAIGLAAFALMLLGLLRRRRT